MMFCQVFLKRMGLPLIIEIPTFPYDNELREGLRKYEDNLYREQFIEYADMVTTYSDDEEIWGRPCIKLVNGIDSRDVLSNIQTSQKKESILFVTVMSMNFWHGLERMIFAISEYYHNKNENDPYVYLTAIGDGPEKKHYEFLTHKFELNEYIQFIGIVPQNQLYKYYEQSDISVDTLGLYKKNMEEACSIKAAEYCANGLPIVCGYKDIRFADDTSFIYRVPNDDTPIDVFRIIEWFRELSKDKDYKKKICDYARDNLTWDNIMKPVIEYYDSATSKNR